MHVSINTHEGSSIKAAKIKKRFPIACFREINLRLYGLYRPELQDFTHVADLLQTPENIVQFQLTQKSIVRNKLAYAFHVVQSEYFYCILHLSSPAITYLALSLQRLFQSQVPLISKYPRGCIELLFEHTETLITFHVISLKGSYDGALHSTLLSSGLNPSFDIRRQNYVSAAAFSPWTCPGTGIKLFYGTKQNRYFNVKTAAMLNCSCCPHTLLIYIPTNCQQVV